MESFFKWVKEDECSPLYAFLALILLMGSILGTCVTISSVYGTPDYEKETKKIQMEVQMLELQIKLAELQGRIKSK